ncbi:flotillin-like FloA family protein [Reichenbachiella sp. MALMAid0571]|uniref:flotillin-like FloA family protein n=1 Tax=Reichenbachiella sp. MALMAid0571 TaxID=3143939 RepID=UPI0032DEB55A
MTQLFFFLALGLVLILMFNYFVPLNLWITALFSGVQIDLMQLVFMRIRKSPVKDIILSLITCQKAGINITLEELETHSLASGNIVTLTKALLKVKSENLKIDSTELMAQNLAGNDLMKYIEIRKNDSLSGIGDIKRKLCDKIMNQLNEDQVRDVEKYLKASFL